MDKPILMNLQLFAEGDPVDPVDDTPIDTINPEGEPTPEPTPEPFLSIKYNKEDMALDREKAVELAQKGMNYDKVHERLQSLENDPRLGFADELANIYGFESADEYMKEVNIDELRKQQEQSKIDNLVKQNIPKEFAEEILEGRKFREKFKEIDQENQKNQKSLEEFNELKDEVEEIKAPEDVKPEAWQLQKEKGISLLDAYNRIHIKELEQSIKVDQTNKANADKSTGSLTGKGGVEGSHFTREQVEGMSQSEVTKNYDAIMKSMETW